MGHSSKKSSTNVVVILLSLTVKEDFETFTKNSLKNILFCYPPHTNKHTQIWRIVKLFNSNKTVQAICLTNYVV